MIMNRAFGIIIFLLLSLCSYGQHATQIENMTTKLDEIQIKAESKMFTTKNGNVKIEIANSILNSIPNTIDLLAKLPKIQLSSDRESITVIGKGNPLIYIDNQKIGMNDLKALAVDDIKSIEIINNPSSKYEAAGRVVILITRKLSKKEGYQMSFSEVASFKNKFNNYLGLNSSFKRKKIEWKANFNYNALNPWEGHSISYQIPYAGIASKYSVEADSKKPQFIFGGGLFYKINEDDYLSFNFNSKLQKDSFGIATQTKNRQNEDEKSITTASDNINFKNFTNSFVNYSKKIKKIDLQLFTGFQYSNFNQDLRSIVANNYNDTQFELAQNRKQLFNIDVFSGRVDLEKKFKNEIKWEFGMLYLAANANTDLDILNYSPDALTISNYNLKEKNKSAYSQLAGTFKKIEYSFGLRVEETSIDGQFKEEEKPLIKKEYVDFFPKLQLNFPIDSLKSITMNYSKSISRPNYSSTSQGSVYINPYFLYSSNINLDPTIIHEVASSFQYKDKSVKLLFYKNTNPVYSSFIFDELQNTISFKETNFEKESGVNLEFNLPFSHQFWSTTNSFIFAWNKIEDPSALFKESKPYLYYYTNQIFKLPSKYSLSITGWGLTEQKEGVFERNAKFIMDLAISKTFFTNWDCTLSYNDIFRSTIYAENFSINNINSQSRYLVDSHEISFSIKYSFGKMKKTEFNEKNIDENSGRIR